MMDLFSATFTWTWDQVDLLYFLLKDRKWAWISNFRNIFFNIFSELTSSICNAVSAKLFCSGILRFKYLKLSQILGILPEFEDVTRDIKRFFWSVVMYFWTLVRALNLMLAFLVIFNRCIVKLNLLLIVIPNTFSCLLFLRVLFPHTRLVWNSSSTCNIKIVCTRVSMPLKNTMPLKLSKPPF